MHYTDAAGDCIWTGGRDIVRKAEKIGIVAALCGIALLFLIASTDLVLEEDRKEVYTIAFITDGSADDRFLSLRRGMEKAAKKWNVDLVTDAVHQWKCKGAGDSYKRSSGKWCAGSHTCTCGSGTDEAVS